MILHDLREGHHHGVCRRTGHREAKIVVTANSHRLRQGKGMASAGLLVRWRDHPDIVGKPPCNRLQQV
jgi:hypothetical protein